MTVRFRDDTIRTWIEKQAHETGKTMSMVVETIIREEIERQNRAGWFVDKEGLAYRATDNNPTANYGRSVLVDAVGKVHGPKDLGEIMAASSDTTDEWILKIRRAGYNVRL
jgi:hypothetical protein